MDQLINGSILKAITYRDYLNIVNGLVAIKGTTGPVQSEERIYYTKLNASRMRRLDKTIVIPDTDIEAFCGCAEKQTWLVLLESWCGDAAQAIPVLNKIAEAVPAIDLKVLLRDENPKLMDLFLTDGSRSIPKLIVLDEEGEVLGSWGPRSKIATELVLDYKMQHGKIDEKFKEELQLWYNMDKGREIINDLKEEVCCFKSPEPSFI
ncbi:thioredoxin family protein [Flavobacteriaceae bacterium F89]|uniref:Thioredoxin family protein n=1 Tax=Cerina litoralis TaxID=2874477 RepID=A0AAE3EYM7_9FLAO|nr:thioredoxin family protein [Cerina litoralis]MCG2462738.1 thioredoxin family protein [Cerina litoralis]